MNKNKFFPTRIFKNFLIASLSATALLASQTANAQKTNDVKTLEKNFQENLKIRQTLLTNLKIPSNSRIEGDNFDLWALEQYHAPTAKVVSEDLEKIEVRLKKGLLNATKLSQADFINNLINISFDLSSLREKSINISESSFSSCNRAVYQFAESSVYGQLFLAEEAVNSYKKGSESLAMCYLMLNATKERTRSVYISTNSSGSNKEPPFKFCKKEIGKNYQKNLQMWSCDLQSLKKYIR